MIDTSSLKEKFPGQRECLFFASFLVVVCFCCLGCYAYPSADDYSFTNMLREKGFWGAQHIWYISMTARCANTFLLNLACLWRLEQIYPFLSFTTSIFMFTVLSLGVRTFIRRLPAGLNLFLTLFFQALWITSFPALNETFYWLSGMPYTWVGTFSVLTIAGLIGVLREKKTGLFFGSFLLLVLFNGMILEPISLMQIGISFSLMGYFLWRRQYREAVLAGMVFLAALCAFGVMLFSPGTAVRMSGTALSRFTVSNLIRTVGVAAAFGGITVLKFFMKPVIYVLLLYMPVIASEIKVFDEGITARFRVWHIFLLTACIAPLLQAFAGLATGAGLPARAEGLVIWIMGVTWLFLWVFGYRNEAAFARIRALRIYPWRGAILALCLVLNSNFISLLHDLPIASSYAAENREREVLILQQKAEGKADIVVPTLTVKPRLLFFSDLRPSPNDWKNQSFAKYWGVRSISALPASMIGDEQKVRNFREGNLRGLEVLAAAGDAEIQFMLGEIYDTTFAPANDVAKDNVTAAKWYRMAADQGYGPAQRRLTRFYAMGMGVPKNYLYAVYWLFRSQV